MNNSILTSIPNSLDLNSKNDCDLLNQALLKIIPQLNKIKNKNILSSAEYEWLRELEIFCTNNDILSVSELEVRKNYTETKKLALYALHKHRLYLSLIEPLQKFLDNPQATLDDDTKAQVVYDILVKNVFPLPPLLKKSVSPLVFIDFNNVQFNYEKIKKDISTNIDTGNLNFLGHILHSPAHREILAFKNELKISKYPYTLSSRLDTAHPVTLPAYDSKDYTQGQAFILYMALSPEDKEKTNAYMLAAKNQSQDPEFFNFVLNKVNNLETKNKFKELWASLSPKTNVSDEDIKEAVSSIIPLCKEAPEINLLLALICIQKRTGKLSEKQPLFASKQVSSELGEYTNTQRSILISYMVRDEIIFNIDGFHINNIVMQLALDKLCEELSHKSVFAQKELLSTALAPAQEILGLMSQKSKINKI